MNPVLRWMGGRLARYLATPIRGAQTATASLEQLAAALKAGDVLLVEGNTRVSTAIKYLTQSTWSHAMFYIGDALGPPGPGEEAKVLIEADMLYGIRAVPLTEVSGLNSRICRPVGLSKDDLQKVIQFAVSHIGGHYDLKNVFDLARYLIPTPPVPTRWRRRMIAFGSGDPTRAICSTLVAEAFQSVHYPILPEVKYVHDGTPGCNDCYHEVMHIRHYSLFTPRDFDISPYFEVVKPTIAKDFDYRQVAWAQEDPVLSREGAPMPKYETTLTRSETVAEGTMAFHFAKPAGFKFTAGQSMFVSLIDPPETDAKGNARTYSIVSAPHENELVVATRMRDTAFKRTLKAMPAGGRVGLRGPAGMFTLDPADARPAVLLAGGIGITPFVSMMRDAAQIRLARDLWLFYSNRRPEDAAFLDELAALPKRHSRCHFVGTMVEMDKSSRPWSGETGLLDRAMLERHLKSLGGNVYYIAGPPGLVEAMQKMLTGAGVAEDAIHTDEFFGY